MDFWLCHEYCGRLTLTNYCPYRGTGDDRAFWFWYPFWLGGQPVNITLDLRDPGTRIEGFGGGTIPGTCRNLTTGEVIEFDALLPITPCLDKVYYPWGVKK